MTGPHNGGERGDTAPMSAARGPSENGPDRGYRPDAAAPEPPPGSQDRTRPTFPPPDRRATVNAGRGGPPPHPSGPPRQAPVPPAPQAPYRQNVPAPPGGPPGTARYQAQHPSTPPPGRDGGSARSPLSAVADHLREVPGRSPGSITPLGWAWRGVALLAISVVSGLLWLLVVPDGGDDPVAGGGPDPAQPPGGKYRFRTLTWTQGTGNCGDVSTGRIAEYFEGHPCRHLTRALYTTTLADGARVLTSVVTAKMPTTQSASRLEELTTRSGTGNIEDLVSSGRPVPDGFPDLDGDLGYASQQQGRLVVIGESAYFRSPDRDDTRLQGVTKDALRLGRAQDQRPR